MQSTFYLKECFFTCLEIIYDVLLFILGRKFRIHPGLADLSACIWETWGVGQPAYSFAKSECYRMVPAIPMVLSLIEKHNWMEHYSEYELYSQLKNYIINVVFLSCDALVYVCIN